MKVEDALMSYAEEGNTERIKKVIKKGIDVNIKHKHHGYTPLHLASKNGHLDAMKVLLENGGDANARSYSGHTPLHLAARHGHEDAFLMLLEYNADINAENDDRNTPLINIFRHHHGDDLKRAGQRALRGEPG